MITDVPSMRPEQRRRIEQRAANGPRWKNQTTGAKKIYVA